MAAWLSHRRLVGKEGEEWIERRAPDLSSPDAPWIQGEILFMASYCASASGDDRAALQRPTMRLSALRPNISTWHALQYMASNPFKLLVGDFYNVSKSTVCGRFFIEPFESGFCQKPSSISRKIWQLSNEDSTRSLVSPMLSESVIMWSILLIRNSIWRKKMSGDLL